MNDYGRTATPWVALLASTLIVVTGVTVAAIFGSGSHFGSEHQFARPPATARLAAAVVKLDIGPTIDDQQLERIVESAMKRAETGDLEAAAFVFELAAQQRAAAAKASASAPTDKVEAPSPTGADT